MKHLLRSVALGLTCRTFRVTAWTLGALSALIAFAAHAVNWTTWVIITCAAIQLVAFGIQYRRSSIMRAAGWAAGIVAIIAILAWVAWMDITAQGAGLRG